ncbi:MAG: hypothetical protein ABJV04_12810 [Aliiglaciecola sp.]|uniref:hypothetical protein n=1 Tax=Aliiglaciecola sp. TaxID=1872441 RepID=UPI003296E490
MTDQTYSSIEFRNESYWLVEAVPFSPYQYGIGSYDISTDNVLGFSGHFVVREGKLFVNYLTTTHNAHHISSRNYSQSDTNAEQDPNVAPTTDIDSEVETTEDLIPAVASKGKPVPPPKLNGKEPEKSFDNQWTYDDLNMLLNYTGELVLEAVESNDMAEQDPWSVSLETTYDLGQVKKGWTLYCQNGRVTKVTPIGKLSDSANGLVY